MLSYLKPPSFRHGATLRKISAKAPIRKRNYSKEYDCKNQPKQGCLPWQNPEEQVDGAKKCKSCKPKGLLSTFKELSVCERRRFEKCMGLFKKYEECLGMATDLKHLRHGEKEYPMQHAVQKKCLPGCPIPKWREIQKTKRNLFWRKRKAPECCKEEEKSITRDDFVVEKDCELCLYDKWMPKIPTLRPCAPTPKKKLGPVKRRHCYPGMPPEPLTAEGRYVGGKCSAEKQPKIECMEDLKKNKEQISRAAIDAKVPLPDWNHHGRMDQ